MSGMWRNRKGLWLRLVQNRWAEPDEVGETHDDLLVAWCAGLGDRRRTQLVRDLHDAGRCESERSRAIRAGLIEAPQPERATVKALAARARRTGTAPTPVRVEPRPWTGLPDLDLTWIVSNLTASHLAKHRALRDGEPPNLTVRTVLDEHLQYWRQARFIPAGWDDAAVRRDLVDYVDCRLVPA